MKHFDDPDVCKFFVCGFCPYEEFRRTKNDVGDCPQVHDEGCRSQWEALDDREKDRYSYERDLMRKMDRFMMDLQRRIDSNKQRLAATQQPLYLADDKATLEKMTKDIDDLLAHAAKLGEEGDIDAAEAATKQADALRERRSTLERQAEGRSGSSAARGLAQSVCPISGLIINDEESRLRDHHSGRNYNAWKKFHEMHAALRETLRRRDEERPRPRSPRRDGRHRDHRDMDDRGGSHRSDRHRDFRHRGRDRYRRRSRSRSYDRRRRSRSRSRSKSRDRYRDQGYSRDKPRRGDLMKDYEERRQGSPEDGEAPQEAYGGR